MEGDTADKKQDPLPSEGAMAILMRRDEGIACSRCRKHKIKCSKMKPCCTCSRMGLEDQCDAIFGVSACWLCRRSKIKCDKKRPCGTCMKKGRSKECLSSDHETGPMEEDAVSVKQEDAGTVRPRIETPNRPWPLRLEMEFGTVPPRMLEPDEKDGGLISPLIVRTSQLGYDHTSILYMFNTMGEDLSNSIKNLMTSLANYRPNMFNQKTSPPSSLLMARSESC
ncbi:hypothetical protein GUITHDRAFT_151552, partial [Guillardia theta CCMP2712]